MISEYMQFYGASFRDVMDMPQNWFFLLYGRIRTVEARRLIKLLDISAYPHVDEHARRNIHQRLMVDSGYLRSKEEADETNEYSAGWDILRGLGRKA